MANKVINIIKNIVPFLQETKGELKRVQWPSRRQATQYTLIVIGASLVVAFFLGGLDFLFTYLINKFIIS
ncbi:MAG: preprotein translocase subunit SecE [bacterium]